MTALRELRAAADERRRTVSLRLVPDEGLGLPPTPAVLGCTVPRLWTPPLRELTPETSYGFDAVRFSRETLGAPMYPWQEWTAIHAGELLPDGRPRFRIVIVLVSRQNGKTYLVRDLSLFWLFVEQHPLIVGMSTNLDYAREAWTAAHELAGDHDELGPDFGTVRTTNGQEMWTTDFGTRYKIAAKNRRGGRSLTITRLMLDELREHHSWDAWNAASKATNAVRDHQIWAISNQGDDNAIVLDSLRDAAIRYIETGEGDPRVGLFEYSAPDGADPEDVDALAQANPNLGYLVQLDALLGDAARAKENGGEELAGFKTESMCMRVHQLNPAIDPARFADCGCPGTLDDVRDRIAMCLDVAPGGTHATAVAAARLDDGRVRGEVVGWWDGPTCTRDLRAALPRLVRTVRPKVLGWFPDGPAAAVAAEMAKRRRGARAPAWPPAGVTIETIREEVPSVCMGFADLVNALQFLHSDDPLMTRHAEAAQKLAMGDRWVFGRGGTTPVDCTYATAGAVHLARTLPAGPGKPRIVRSR